MSVTSSDIAAPLPMVAEPARRSIAWTGLRWLGMLLASLPVQVAVWAYVFWAYHHYAIDHGLEQTQKWYYDQDALPLYAHLEDDWRGHWEAWRYSIPPLAIFVAWVPLIVARLKGVRIPTVAWLVACFTFVLCMNVAVAEIDGGWDAITRPFAGNRRSMEYIGDVPKVGDKPLEFIQNYPQMIRDRDVCHHAGTHPPGGILFLWLVGKWWGQGLFHAVAATILVGAMGVVPAYLLARRVYGETVGTLAAGLYVLTPNLVLFGGATCMDGVFALMPIVAAWLFAEAVMPRLRAMEDGTRVEKLPAVWVSAAIAVLMGLAMSAGAFMTFATCCIGIFSAIYNLFAIGKGWRYFLRVAMVNVIAAGVMAAVYGLAYWRGWFDVVDCVRAAVDENARVMGTGREDLYNWLDVSSANLFAFLIGVGAVVTALVGRRVARAAWDVVRWRGVDAFALAVAVAIVAIAFGAMFHFEVERIWIFLSPLMVAVAARSMVGATRAVRWVTFGIGVVVLFAQTYAMELLLYTWW